MPSQLLVHPIASPRRILRKCAPFMLAPLLAGLTACSHQMKMPPQELECTRLLDAQQGPALIVKQADVELPTREGIDFELECHSILAFQDVFVAPIEGWRKEAQGRIVLDCQGVGIWRTSDGRLETLVFPSSPLPDEVASGPELVAINPQRSVLATCRDQVMQFWSIPDGTLLTEFPFSRRQIIESVTEYEGKPSYSTVTPESPTESTFADDGNSLTAWVGSERAWLTWDTRTGKLLRRVAAAPPREETSNYLAACSDLMVTRDLEVRKPKSTQRLFPPGEFVTDGRQAWLSDDCRILVTELRPRPFMFDFTPDVTPPHIRIWDADNASLLTWMPSTRVMGFVPGTHLILLNNPSGWENELSLLDPASRRELCRTSTGRTFSTHLLDDGRTILCAGRFDSAIWKIQPEPTTP